MTVNDIIKQESNVSEWVFFDNENNFIDFCFSRDAARLIHCFGNRAVKTYFVYPDHRYGRGLNGNPILFFVKVFLK